MLLAVSEPPDSGRSTAATALAEAFDPEYISGGDIFRELAAERDMTTVEFSKLAEEDDRTNRDLDRRLHNIALDRDDVLFESRLVDWFAGDAADLRFWLDAPVDVCAERITDCEGKPVDVAREGTTTREASKAKQYMEYYNINYSDLPIYDISLSIVRWEEHEVSEVITSVAEAYDPEADEGKYPADGVRYDF